MGLGTFGSDKYGLEQIAEAVYGAIRFGYRLIDCAAVYQNEDQIGKVLKWVVQEGEMEAIRQDDKGCRLVKGQVFLWEGANGWEDLWDVDGSSAA